MRIVALDPTADVAQRRSDDVVIGVLVTLSDNDDVMVQRVNLSHSSNLWVNILPITLFSHSSSLAVRHHQTKKR